MIAGPIVLVCDYSLTYLGGAQVAFVRQAQALHDAGHEVVVVAPGASVQWPDAQERLTIIDPPARFTIPVLGLPVLDPVDALTAMLTDLLRSGSARGVVVHSEFALAAAALCAARAARVPSAHVVHSFFWRAPRALAPFAPLVRGLHRRTTGLMASGVRCRGADAIGDALRTMTLRVAQEADVVLSPSAHQAERLRAAGVRDVRVLSNVAPPAHGAQADAEVDGPLTLLWAGRFAPEKRLPVALRAMRIVHDRLGPGRVHLHVAGGMKPPQHDVTFHGRVPSDEIAVLLARADAALLTSIGYDNQPMAILEAFAHGRPVIVCDPVLHTEFGAAVILSPTPDAEGLADAICAAASDREGLRQAGVRATSYASERAPRAHADALLGALGATANRVLSER